MQWFFSKQLPPNHQINTSGNGHHRFPVTGIPFCLLDSADQVVHRLDHWPRRAVHVHADGVKELPTCARPGVDEVHQHAGFVFGEDQVGVRLGYLKEVGWTVHRWKVGGHGEEGVDVGAVGGGEDQSGQGPEVVGALERSGGLARAVDCWGKGKKINLFEYLKYGFSSTVHCLR